MKTRSRAWKIWRLTQQALAESLRLRVGWALGSVVFGVALGASGLGMLNFGSDEGRFIGSMAFGALHLAGSLLAAMLPVALFFNGVDGGHLALLLVRGVSRSEWLLARLAAAVVVVAWLAISLGVLLTLLLSVRDLSPDYSMLMRACVLAGARLAVIAGLALLASVLVRSPWVALVLTAGLVVAAQLAAMADWMLATADSPLAMIGRGALRMVPHLARLSPDAGSASVALAYAAGWVALLGLAASLIFAKREL